MVKTASAGPTGRTVSRPSRLPSPLTSVFITPIHHRLAIVIDLVAVIGQTNGGRCWWGDALEHDGSGMNGFRRVLRGDGLGEREKIEG